MNKLKVLLYSDGSYQAFSAAVYAAMLLQNSPQLHLTILQVQEKDEGSFGVKYSWPELRSKYIKYSWPCSSGINYNWLDAWPENPDLNWLKKILDESDEIRKKYVRVLTRTNSIFLQRKEDVHYQLLCLNTCFSEKSDKSEMVQAICNYLEQNSFNLLIMGTRGFSKLRGVICGSLSQEVFKKSKVPVLLIKKLTRDFFEDYL